MYIHKCKCYFIISFIPRCKAVLCCLTSARLIDCSALLPWTYSTHWIHSQCCSVKMVNNISIVSWSEGGHALDQSSTLEHACSQGRSTMVGMLRLVTRKWIPLDVVDVAGRSECRGTDSPPGTSNTTPVLPRLLWKSNPLLITDYSFKKVIII